MDSRDFRDRRNSIVGEACTGKKVLRSSPAPTLVDSRVAMVGTQL